MLSVSWKRASQPLFCVCISPMRKSCGSGGGGCRGRQGMANFASDLKGFDPSGADHAAVPSAVSYKLDLQLDLGPEPDPRQSRSTCQEGGVPVSEGPGSGLAIGD